VGKLITLGDAAKGPVILKHVLRQLISPGNLKAYRINAGAIRIDGADLASVLEPVGADPGGARCGPPAVDRSLASSPIHRWRTTAPWSVIARCRRGRWDSPVGQGNRM
jgi:hypothetical protein